LIQEEGPFSEKVAKIIFLQIL